MILCLEFLPRITISVRVQCRKRLSRYSGVGRGIIGRRFRLVHVTHGREVFEVSTFRRKPDLDERKGRSDDDGLIVWRDNCYGSIEEDAGRRDFTVNAIYFNPLSPDSGFVDYTGGLGDIKKRLVRTIGAPDVRLAEDPVRALRACKLVGAIWVYS